MIDQILKFLCILSFVTFLLKRLPLLINKDMLYLLLGCFILYILYSLYKKWKEEKIKETPIFIEEKIKERSFEERLLIIFEKLEEKIKERSFEDRLDSFEDRLDSFEEKIIKILEENRPKRKKKN